MIKQLLTILLLFPCLLKAQTASDTTYADTTTRIIVTIKGSYNFDTVRIANNSIQGFTYEIKGFSGGQQSYGHLVFYVTNLNGVYSLRLPPSSVTYTSVPQSNYLEVVQSGNFIIVRYRAASGNTNTMNWTLTKTKIGL